jgi:protein-S-isoprenylcysteine O-methyltransferase Ste14
MATTGFVGAPAVRWLKGERGEWYVVIQAALILLVVFGPATASWLPAWPAGAGRVSSFLGVTLLVGGIVWIIAGAAQLAVGRSLSALPSPTSTATLIDTGVFACVRHPMYCGAIWAVVGAGLWSQGSLMLVYGALLAVLFDLKASREERKLVEKFPEYADYERRVPKLVPFWRLNVRAHLRRTRRVGTSVASRL